MRLQIDRTITTVFSIGLLLACTGGIVRAQARQLARDTSQPMSQKRVALVIGNGQYSKAPALGNPANDAADMAAVLKTLGFEVIKGTDTNLVQMRRLIREFGEKLEEQKGVGLFYYAGHGVEVKGKNYLIPVDADIAREVETEDYAIDLNAIMRQMEAAGNGFNIVILDACRNNPFARGWNRSVDRGGLTNVSAPAGTFIAFAAAPGSTALDGKGARNGVFTGALIKQLRKPGLKLEEVFKGAREDVMTATSDQQVPWDSSSVQGEFFFDPNGRAARDGSVTAQNTAITSQEREAWALVKDSGDPDDLRFFLRKFPNGSNATIARDRLEEIAWSRLKSSTNAAEYQSYLDEFPDGNYSAAAKIKLRQLQNTGQNNAPAGIEARSSSPGRPDQIGPDFVVTLGDSIEIGDKKDNAGVLTFREGRLSYKRHPSPITAKNALQEFDVSCSELKKIESWPWSITKDIWIFRFDFLTLKDNGFLANENLTLTKQFLARVAKECSLKVEKALSEVEQEKVMRWPNALNVRHDHGFMSLSYGYGKLELSGDTLSFSEFKRATYKEPNPEHSFTLKCSELASAGDGKVKASNGKSYTFAPDENSDRVEAFFGKVRSTCQIPG